MSARNHAKSIQIRKLISIYMVEHEELSESLVKGLFSKVCLIYKKNH